MHDRRRILLAVVDRLRERVGALVPGGVHAARAAGLADPSEGTVIIVTVERSSNSGIWDNQSSAFSRTYVVTVTVGMDGLAPDLAGDRVSCPEALDALAVEIEAALKRNDVLDHDTPALGLRPWAFEFVDDAVAFQPGGKGQLGNLVLRYALAVRQEDGAPTSIRS